MSLWLKYRVVSIIGEKSFQKSFAAAVIVVVCSNPSNKMGLGVCKSICEDLHLYHFGILDLLEFDCPDIEIAPRIEDG